MAMTSQEPSPFTIDDFPPEIIELFLPAEYKPSTINTLKLVNKKFYYVFGRDKFFKYFLHYPESFYLSDLNFDSKAHGVKEAVDNIKKGVWGKWEGYLRLQNAHLDNLKNGRTNSFSTITFEGEELYRCEEVLDVNNDHWLCCAFQHNGHVAMTNLTTNRGLSHDLGEFYAVHFFPGLMLVRNVDLTFAVYRLHCKDGVYAFDLQYEAVLSEARIMEQLPFVYSTVSGKDKSTSTVRSFLFGWESNDNDGTFTIWDLDTDARSVLSIRDLLTTRYASKIVRFFDGEFPNVIVIVDNMTEERPKAFPLYVFNIETNRITHHLGNWNRVFVNVVLMSSNIVSVCFGNDLTIYRLPKSRPGVVLDAELIYTAESPASWQFLSATRIVWVKENVAHILKVSGSGIEDKEFQVPTDYRYVGFFIPDVILLKRRCLFDPFHTGLHPVKAVNLRGEHLFDLEVRSDFLNEPELSRQLWWYPSRVVNPLNSRFDSTHSFKIYHF